MFSSQSLRNAIDHKQAVPVKSHVHVVTAGNALSSQMTKCAFSSGQFLFQQNIYFMSVLLHNMSTTFCPTVSCFFSFCRSLYSNQSRVFNFLTTSYLKVWLLWYFLPTSETLWQLIDIGEVKSRKTSQNVLWVLASWIIVSLLTQVV